METKNMQICPRCSKEYDEYPALSRRDNSTDICSRCGNLEAMMDFIPFERLPEEELNVEISFQKKIGVDFEDWKEWKKLIDSKRKDQHD
jgi:hypothetical protein